MVCKKSLYCWKNGPCASDQTRKQIWEDNIRFRENLRDTNQSDHYWSFQISKNCCLCLEGEELICDRPLPRRHRSTSLQKLHQIDCTSITHDFNGLKFRNCYVHCPIHDFKKSSEVKRADTPVPQSLAKKEVPTCSRDRLRPLLKLNRDKPEYCQRYKNTLTPAFMPHMKTKFLSQTNLNSFHENNSTHEKKSLHASCENLYSKALQSKEKSTEVNVANNDIEENKKPTAELITQKEAMKVKISKKELNPVLKFPNRDYLREYTPISRTTRKMLSDNKKIPFLTYGCNNKNLDIGSKRTHNVLASKLEVYPNALSAKQQKNNIIMKYIQREKEFQKKCIPEKFRKKLVNHSSLWSTDYMGKERKSLQRKNTKYGMPLMCKPTKASSAVPNQFDSLNYKTYSKPQVYFY